MTTPFALMQLIEAASLLVLGAFAYAGLGERLPRQGAARGIVVGLCMGIAALTSMADPLVWRPGYNIDARSAAIVLAGPFGGPGAIAVVAALAVVMRVALGGVGVPAGLLGIGLVAAGSLAWWRHLATRNRMPTRRDLHWIAASAALLALPSILLWADWAEGGPDPAMTLAVMAVSFGGTELLGYFLIWVRERRDALADFTASEAKLRVITDGLPGAIYQRRLAPDGTISLRFISEGVRDVVGLSAEELVRHPGAILKALAPADGIRFRAVLAASAQSLTPFLFQGEVVRPDGSRGVIRSSATPAREPGGDIVWNGIVMDVSEQVRLEGEVRAAREAAERASEAQSRFLAFITHEFRSPLNAINGYTELAAMSPLLVHPDRVPWQQAQLADYLATIRLASDHLTAMTDDLLDLGKAEAGRLTIDLCWFDLGPAIEQAASLVRRSAEARNVSFDIVVAPGHRVFADPRRLQQILLNLTTNAVKYSHRGGCIVIRAEAAPGQDVLTIADHGIGMTPAQLEIALETYGQVDNSLNRVVAGTGLGLPLVRQLVELHGGTLVLASATGAGTRVTVTLPHPPEPTDPALPMAEPAA
jgi:signal transduction histidine kinase